MNVISYKAKLKEHVTIAGRRLLLVFCNLDRRDVGNPVPKVVAVMIKT
jgi:hypothetical protein